MDATKRNKIIFWSVTTFIFLFEGVMPALTSQTELAKEGVRNLGYPVYFGNALVVFKVCGTLILMIPKSPKRMKKWAYAGFAFDFIFACISHYSIDGFGFQTIFPLIILMVSYVYYHKLNSPLKSSQADLLFSIRPGHMNRLFHPRKLND